VPPIQRDLDHRVIVLRLTRDCSTRRRCGWCRDGETDAGSRPTATAA